VKACNTVSSLPLLVVVRGLPEGPLFKFRTIPPVSNLSLYPTVVTCVFARNSFLQLHSSSTTLSLSVFTYTCTDVPQTEIPATMPFCFTLPAAIWRCKRVLSTTFICHLGSFYCIAANTNPLSLLKSKVCLRLIPTTFTQLNGTKSSWATARFSSFLLLSKFVQMV
jgi:hypothetical protein